MGDNDVQGESFYTETGQIADIGNAQELARTEENLGRNAALTQENRMVTEYENGGLTEQAVFNEGVGALLLEKYPETFVEKVKDGRKEVILKPYIDDLGREKYVFNKRGLQGLNLSNMSEERAEVLSKLPVILDDLSNREIKQANSVAMSRMLMGAGNVSFSRKGINSSGGDGVEWEIPNSLNNFSEVELALFKRVCEFRNEQQKLNKVEKEALEANKVTLDKLRELL